MRRRISNAMPRHDLEDPAPLHQLPDAQDHVASNQKKRVKSAEKMAKKLFKAARS